MTHLKGAARRLLLALPLVALAGCKAMGPDFARPADPASASYAATNKTVRGPSAVFGVETPLRWWEALGSPDIDALVDRAMAGNKSLAASLATLEKAREHARSVQGKLYPQVDANAGIERQRFNLSAFGIDPSSFGLPSAGNPEATLLSVGGGVSYDPDLFGANRRAREQALADEETQLRETQAAHLTIAGRVVLQALTIGALDDRIAAVNALIAEDERNVTLVDKKRRGGEGTMVEVLNAQAQLAGDRTVLPQLDQQRVEARDMLAILLGISPGELGPTAFSLSALTLPANVPVALPSELVHKRPDILAAEARLHSATAAVGMATAKLYPSISLGATFQQMTTHPLDIFTAGANGFNIFARLAAPIFDGGQLKADKRAAEAELRASAARYQQTVLEAFGQVSDLLSALENDARSVGLQGESVNVAERSLSLSRRSFQIGNSGVLTVLDSSRTAQRARLALLDARGRQFVDLVRLYVATAGGWTGPAIPPPPAP